MKALSTFLLAVLLLVAPRANAHDPYDFAALMVAGRFKGQPVDTTERRPLYRTEENCYANFWHRGRFWVACVDPQAAEKVAVQKTPFGATRPGSHISWRFTLRSGFEARLTPQSPMPGDEPVFLRDLVFSAEAAYAVDQAPNFSVSEAWKGDYNIALRAMSLETQVNQAIVRASSRVQQFVLRLEPQRVQKMLQESLELSHRLGTGNAYTLLGSNCRTVFFDALDLSSLDGKRLFNRTPAFPIWNLRWDRLIAGKPVDLQTEYFGPDWKNSCANLLRTDSRDGDALLPGDF